MEPGLAYLALPAPVNIEPRGTTSASRPSRLSTPHSDEQRCMLSRSGPKQRPGAGLAASSAVLRTPCVTPLSVAQVRTTLRRGTSGASGDVRPAHRCYRCTMRKAFSPSGGAQRSRPKGEPLGTRSIQVLLLYQKVAGSNVHSSRLMKPERTGEQLRVFVGWGSVSTRDYGSRGGQQ